MESRPKVHRKGHSKRVRRFEEEIGADYGLDPDSTLRIDDLLTERRHLLTATFVACFSLLLWTVAVAASYWVSIDGGPNGVYMNNTRQTYYHGHMGLFRMCRTTASHSWRDAGLQPPKEECRYFYVNPKKADYSTDVMLDRTILEYTRSQIAFSCVSFVLILMAIAFSVYTFSQQRYMFKRLAGGVHFLVVGVILVMLEIETNCANYEQAHFHTRHPLQASWSYGACFFLAWVCLLLFAGVGAMFIVYSRKRKLDLAADRGFSLS